MDGLLGKMRLVVKCFNFGASKTSVKICSIVAIHWQVGEFRVMNEWAMNEFRVMSENGNACPCWRFTAFQ